MTLTSRVEVMEVEHVGFCDVYDITVRGHHNFFAEGVNVHNSADPKPKSILGSKNQVNCWKGQY